MQIRRARRSLAVAALVVMGGLGTAFAQTETGRIEGVVVDSTGGAIPGVTVTLTNVATATETTVVTDETGRYILTPVRAGTYDIKVTLDGFKTAENKGVVIAVAQVAKIDFTLEPGGVSEVVQVVAASPVIDKVTSSIGTVIQEQQVQDLPLNGRNYTQLATLTPGVTRGSPGSVSAGGGGGNAETFRYADTGGAAISANGLREVFNNYLLDGVDNNETLVNTTTIFPPTEGIQEFKVITTNASAEYGRAGGAVVNVVTKSGGNVVRGSAFVDWRPASLASTPYFVQKENGGSGEKPDFNRTQYGGSIGGPIVKSKLFYFGEYAGLKSTLPVEAGQFVTVPTAKMRNGDFSELLNGSFTGTGAPIIIYDPATGQPFPGNVIPPALINAVGRNYLGVYPLPTRTDRYQQNYATNRERKSTYNDGTARIDYVMSEKATMFGRFSFNVDGFSDGGRIPGYQAGFGAGDTNNNSYATAIGYTRVLSATLVNDTRFGYNDQRYEFLPVGYGTNQNAAIGIPGPGSITSDNGISLIGGGNGSWIEYLGDFGQYVVPQKTIQVVNTTTWLKGAHTMKGGFSLIRRMLDSDRIRFGKGFYFFSDRTSSPPLGFTGFEVSDMLIAKTDFTATGLPVPIFQTRSWENSLFFQDDWRVNNKLTLNLGLRYDVFTPYVEVDDRLANYDQETGTIVLPGQNGAPRATIDTDWNNWGPRAGFAYQFNDKNVLRGAYGLFYTLQRAGIDNELTQSAPFGNVQFRFCCGAGANVALSDPIPLPVPVDPNDPVLPDGAFVVSQPRDSKTPQVQQYSVSFERELGARTALMVAYVGTQGDNLLAQLTTAGFSGDVESRAATLQNIAHSQYNAMQIQLRQTEYKGLTYLIAYTLSKATDDSPGPFNSGNIAAVTPIDPNNLGLDEGPSTYDRRNYFSAAVTYELPFLRDAVGMKRALLGGWQVNGIYTLASGVPFSVLSGDYRAKQVGDPNDGPKTIEEWFNTSAFVANSDVTQMSGRNVVRAPGINTLDMSFFKDFRFTGSQTFQFRFQVFNLFNTNQWGIPGFNLGQPNYGKIYYTTANTERQMAVVLRYLF